MIANRFTCTNMICFLKIIVIIYFCITFQRAWNPFQSAGFRRLDVDHDGLLIWSEFQRVMKKQGTKLDNVELVWLFQQMDTNNNGQIEDSEFKEFLEAHEHSKSEQKKKIKIKKHARRLRSAQIQRHVMKQRNHKQKKQCLWSQRYALTSVIRCRCR